MTRYNSQRKAYPKRNAPFDNAKPQYEGKKSWTLRDEKVKCRDCARYATHDATMRREPDFLNRSDRKVVPVCRTHARKAIATGELVFVEPYKEFLSYEAKLAKWQAAQAPETQGVIL